MNKEVERLLLLMKSYASDNDAQGYLTNSQVKLLLDYINQLETNRDEAIELVKEIKLHYQQRPTMIPSVKIDRLSSLLERGKE